MNKKQIKYIAMLIVLVASYFGFNINQNDVEKLVSQVLETTPHVEVVKNNTSIPTTRDTSYTTKKLDPKKIRVIDGDTFIDDTDNTTYRMLLVDTPESCHLKKNACSGSKEEPNGKEAALFTKQAIEQAKSITIEYDPNKTDKYGRSLAWVFIDDTYLLQSMLAKADLLDGYYTASGSFTEDITKTKFFLPYIEISTKP